MSGGAARRVGRGTAVNWSAWILARALALATLLMLARSLGATELGALLAALAAGVLGAALATGGLADATARQAAAAETSFGRGDVTRAMRRFAAILPLVLAVVVVIAAGNSGDLGLGGVVAAALLAVTQGATTIAASVFRARNQPGRFALATNLAVSAGRALIALLALLSDLSGGAVLWAFALLNLAVAVVTWRHAVRGLPAGATRGHGVAALQLGGVVWSLLGNLDVVVVGLLLGAGPAGAYSIALRVAEFSAQFVIAISLFFLPEATRLAVEGARTRLVALHRAASRWSAASTLLVAGIGFVLAPAIAEIVFPDEASTVATLLRILFAGYAVQGALGVSYATLSALGAYPAIWWSSVVSLPLLVVGTVLLTQFWGLTGAACATLAAYVGLNAFWAWRTAVELAATAFDLRYLRCVAAAAVGWLATWAADAALGPAGPVAALALAGGAGLVAGAAALPALRGLTPSERDWLHGALRRACGGRPNPGQRPAARG